MDISLFVNILELKFQRRRLLQAYKQLPFEKILFLSINGWKELKIIIH